MVACQLKRLLSSAGPAEHEEGGSRPISLSSCQHLPIQRRFQDIRGSPIVFHLGNALGGPVFPSASRKSAAASIEERTGLGKRTHMLKSLVSQINPNEIEPRGTSVTCKVVRHSVSSSKPARG